MHLCCPQLREAIRNGHSRTVELINCRNGVAWIDHQSWVLDPTKAMIADAFSKCGAKALANV
jgi:hypothetical protein